MIQKTHILLILITICLWTGSTIGAIFSCNPSPCQAGASCSALAQAKHFSAVEKIIWDWERKALLTDYFNLATPAKVNKLTASAFC